MNRRIELSVIVPVHGRLGLLCRALAAVAAALERTSQPWELIVVDDASPEDPASCLPSSSILLRNSKRRGFGPSTNRGVEQARGEFCCLLNSDMYVTRDFFSHFRKFFKNPETFAVCGTIEEPDGTDGGFKRLQMTQSGPRFRFAPMNSQESACEVPYANGGGSFFRRSTFLKLNGFNDSFAPYYWEDADLGMRAWKQGFECLYVPELRLRHDRGRSIALDPPREVKRIKQRNRHLFHWQNFTDTPLPEVLRRFLLPEARHYCKTVRMRRLLWLLRDLGQLRRVLNCRRLLRQSSRVSDDTILARLERAC